MHKLTPISSALMAIVIASILSGCGSGGVEPASTPKTSITATTADPAAAAAAQAATAEAVAAEVAATRAAAATKAAAGAKAVALAKSLVKAKAVAKAHEASRIQAARSFYGDWHVHGSTYHFRPNGTGDVASHAGFTDAGLWLNEFDTFTLAPSADGSTLNLTITGRRWQAFDNGGKEVPNPQVPTGTSFSVRLGERFQIHHVRPGLLKGFGNPYLCGVGISAADLYLCGA